MIEQNATHQKLITISPRLKEAMKIAAKKNGRSLNAEIGFALEWFYLDRFGKAAADADQT